MLAAMQQAEDDNTFEFRYCADGRPIVVFARFDGCAPTWALEVAAAWMIRRGDDEPIASFKLRVSDAIRCRDTTIPGRKMMPHFVILGGGD